MDPLKFQVAITDNATSTLEAIQKLLNNLKDVTINVAAGGDIKSLLSSLEKSGNVAVSAEKAAAALKKEEEALLKLKEAAADADREITRLEYNKRGASSDVSTDRTKLEILKNSGDVARKAAEGYQEYYQWVKKAQEEISKIKTNASPVSSIEDATKKTFAETRDFYRRAIYEFAQSIGKVSEDPLQLKSQIEKYREALIRLRDEGKHLLTIDSGGDMSRMVNSLERVVAEYDKVIRKADEMRAKNLEATKYYDIDDQIRRRQESLQRNIQVEAKANEQLSQAKQNQSQLNQQITQQEQKVAEARERLAQATQKQSQGDQQTAQTLNAEAQAAGQAAGQLSKLLADKNAVTEAENKLAQASMMNVAAFIAEGESAQKASAQIGAIVMLLERVSQIKVPDTTAFTQSLNNIAGVKAQGTGLEQLGSHLGDAAEKIKAAKDAIKGGRFGELAKRIDKATESIEKLDVAFGKFHLTIGKDQGLKDFMTGLGEIVTKVRAQMQSLGSGTQTSGLDKAAENYRKNVAKVDDALYRVRNLNLSLGNKLSEAKGLGINVDNRQIYMLQNYIKLLQQARSDEMLMTGKGWVDNGNSLKHLMSETNNYIKVLDGMIEKQRQLALTEERVANVRRQSGALIRRLTEANDKGWDLGLSHPGVSGALASLRDFNGRLSQADMMDAGAIQKLILEFQRLKYSALDAAKAAEKVNSNQEKLNKSIRSKDAKDTEQWAQSMNQASIEANKLIHKMRELKAAKNLGKSIGADTSELEREMAIMQRYLDKLFAIKNGARQFGHTSDWLGKDEFKNASFNADKAATSINRLSSEKQKAASTTSQLTAEEQRLAQALGQTTEHAKGQSQVLSDLKSMAMQYLGVWGGQQFLHNIIEIGGQLEMQRMSIGAILQNQSQANDLFEKIKGLAVQSPFGVVELDQMTKQLTAYGFKYSELFDMTKRLADISAATGTGVDRLALALGHVRSEAALSGYTLRQFSMGNVPLLAKLSEKLGKTTQEIRKMVRAKEISYEDVEGVIKDLTNEGGMFYNMQETISQSVKARFKNVKDAMAIMYGEMAESGMGDVLKSIADALMEITKNWKDVATVVGTGAAMWAAHRVAVMAYTTTLGKTNAAVLASIASHNKQEASILSLASKYRVLTVTEQERLAAARKNIVVDKLRLLLGKTTKAELAARDAATKRLFLSDIQLAMSEKKLTIEELARLVALGKVTKAEALQIITNLQLADSEKMVAVNTIMGTKRLGIFKMGLLAVGGAAKTAALALKSLIFNPAMLGMAAITALIELWQRNNAEMERAKELGNAIFEASQEGLKNTRTMMENTGINAYQADTNSKGEMVLRNLTKSFGTEQESSRTFLVKPEFDSATAQQIIDEWSQYIRDYAGTPNRILNQALLDEAGNVRTLEEQFNYLFNSVQNVANAQKAIVDIADAIQSAQEETGSGWLNEDLVEDFADYDSALKKYNKSIVMAYHEHSRAVKKGIDAARKADSTFAKNTEGMASYSEMLKELVENSKLYSSQAGKAFNEAAEENSGIISRLFANKSDLHLGAEVEAEKEFKVFKDNLKIMLEGLGQDVENLTPEMKQGLMSMFINKVLGQDKLGRMSKEAKDKFIKDFADFIGETIDDAEEITKKRLADWQKRAGEVFIVNQNIKVKTKTITSLHEFAEEVQKDLKEKQEYITKEASHIKQTLTIQTGIKFNMQKIDASELDRVIIQLAEKVKKLAREGHVDTAKSLLSVIQDELMPFRDVLKSIDENKKWLKQEGYPEKDPTKDKSKNKHDSKKSYKDPVAEEWKERIRLLKDANSLYKEWNKRTGEDAALNRVREQYGDIFKKWRTDKNVPWKDFNAEDIIEYRKYIQKIVDEAQTRYNSQRNDKAKNYGKEAEAVLREGKKLLDDIDKYDFDEKAREFKTAFDKALDDMTRRWEIFTSVRNATGNKLLAFDMANIGQESRNLRNAADAMKDKLADEMQRVGGEELLTKIPFSIDIDEEKLRDQFKAALGDSEKYATTIDGLVEAYKKWQKLQQDVVKSDIDVFAKLMGSVVSYSAQIRKINDELAQQKTAIANSGASASQQQEATAVAESQADWKKMKLSADYSNLYNKTIAMSRTEFENAADAVQKMIDKLRDLGTISPDEYLQEVEKLNKARMEWSTTGFLGERGAFGQFISGGNQGLMDYYQQRADAARRRADYLKDIELVPSAAQKNARAEAEHYEKLYNALKKVTDEAQNVVTAFQTLQSGLDLLGNMFDSLGMEGAANAMSDAGGILGGALQGASSLSALGPYGMAAGAAIGLIGGIAQVHDKALERHINKLREDVRGIEANTELIAKSRERTLGYDMGDVRRQMAQQYAQQQFSGSGIQAYIAMLLSGGRQNQSMYEYYSKNSQGTGYQQEYDNLIEQREKYLEILKDQQDKKKKSNDEIEETKAKIAELDDQIAYFTQDLAKELWSIDIKGWADQLSDALASAFENGENMAKAYRDTVTQIIQQMMQKMMQLAILEPMFERLQKQLFGENGKGGVFDPNNPKGSMSKVTAMIADFFGKGGEGEKAITASMEFMTAFQRGMQNAGLTVLNEASNTLSSSMQGTTEETSGLLAGYVNALRQDVSVNRILLTQFVSQMWPDYMDTFANQVTAVQNIDTNVQVIMTMMQMGNGAMFNEIAAMRSRIDNVVMGIDRFAVK